MTCCKDPEGCTELPVNNYHISGSKVVKCFLFFCGFDDIRCTKVSVSLSVRRWSLCFFLTSYISSSSVATQMD